LRTTRLAAVVSGAAACVLLLAGPAAAHVTVQGPGATQGGYTKLTFRVPTEEGAATTKLQVVFPADAPLGSARVKPHPGWTYTVTKTKPAKPIATEGGTIDSVVSTITWTATAGGIKPGEFDEFEVSAGPLPKVEQMVFKAVQTYANGDVVRWIERPAAGSATEPAHPAPVLKLAAATGSGAHAAAAATPSAAASVSAAPEAEAGDGSTEDDSSATSFGVAGLGVGVLALLVAVVALVRSRRVQA
jgi:uncharacterized protein YcnI